jgi:predicted RecA/RadA family phage recombinase
VIKTLGPLLSGDSQSPLAVFNQSRLSINFSDSRERSAPIQAIVGHPQNGAVPVVGQRGFFWAQRPGPSTNGGNVVITFWAPTEIDGTPKANLKAGTIVHLRANSDTQPVIWMLIGEPSDVLKPNGSPIDPCSYSCEVGGPPPPTVPFGLNTKTTGYNPAYWPNAQNPTNTGNPLGQIGPSSSTPCFDTITSDKYKSTPRYGDAPSNVMGEGDLWKNSKDGVTYSRNNGRLEALGGPTSGTFLVGKVNANVSKGDVLYSLKQTTSFQPITLAVASSSNPDCAGRIVGIAVTDYTSGQYATVQQSGLFLISVLTGTGGNYDVIQNNKNGTAIFLGSGGKWSISQPAAGTAGTFLQIGKIYQQGRSIIIDFGPQVKTGAITSTPGGSPPRDPSDPGGGIFTPTGPYSIDLRKLPTQKPLGGQSADSNLVNGWYFA